MAGSYTAQLNLYMPELGLDFDTWGNNPIGLNGDLQKIDDVFKAAGNGTAVGIHIGTVSPSGGGTVPGILKVDGTGVVDALVDNITLKDATDPTKHLLFRADLLSTGVTRTLHAPDADGTIALQSYVRQFMPTGTIMNGYYGATAPPGFVFADGRTIGNVSSAASNRANADCQALFTLLWNF